MLFRNQSHNGTNGFLHVMGWGVVVLCLLIPTYQWSLMQKQEKHQAPINPMALYSSPYGKLFSSLLQQPINAAWHKGIEIHEPKKVDHQVAPKHENAGKMEHSHHGGSDHCDECDLAAGRFAKRQNRSSWLSSMSDEIDLLAMLASKRTNPKPISQAHKLYVAQNIERKLLVAYNLDPTNYGAYDALFLFLTENPVSGLGGEHQLKQAEFITGHTLRVSTLDEVNPLSSITAGLATLNLFMLDFVHEKPKDAEYNKALYLKIGEYLAKYHRLKGDAENAGTWDLVPEAWRIQADERAALIANVAKGLVEKPSENKTN